MRKFLHLGTYCLLVVSFVACKPLARQSVSDITAISDAQLALGVVPIERGDGAQAYRMLLCKKAEAYTPSMLEDKSRCRTALHDRRGAEVAFYPNDFRRSFGTKYKGYAKQATIFSLALVPFAIIGGVAGGWKYIKKGMDIAEGKASFSDKGFSGKLTEDLINKGLGKKGYLYYDKAYKFHLLQFKVNKTGSSDEEIRKAIVAFKEASDTLSTAARLRVKEDNKKLLAELSNLSGDKKTARIEKLKEQVKALNNGVEGDADGSLIKNFDEQSNQLEQLFNTASNEGIPLEELKGTANEIEKIATKIPENLLQREEIITKQRMLDNKDGLEQLSKTADEEISSLKQTLLAQDANSMRGMAEVTGLMKRDQTIGIAAGGGLAAALLLAIDKSVWGYADRQVSKHWNQIFVENDAFRNTRRVRDVQFILQAFADKFGFVVSQRALQLAN